MRYKREMTLHLKNKVHSVLGDLMTLMRRNKKMSKRKTYLTNLKLKKYQTKKRKNKV
jgi:hypothetical protein